MSELTNVFSDIANAIRAKAGILGTMTPTEMSNKIATMPAPYIPPTTTYNLYAPPTSVTNISTLTNLSGYFKDGANATALASYPSLYISRNVTNMYEMFKNSAVNCPITIANGVTDMSEAFSRSKSFNQPLAIPDSVVNMANTFSEAISLSCPVVLGNGVKNMFCAFKNAPISTIRDLPPQVEDLSFAFYGTNFNSPIHVPSTVTNMTRMASHSKYNCPLDLSAVSTSVNIGGIIEGTPFNSTLKFNSALEDLQDFFKSMTEFHQDFSLPANIKRIGWTFSQSIGINNIYFNDVVGPITFAPYCFSAIQNSNIHGDILLDSGGDSLCNFNGMFDGASNTNIFSKIQVSNVNASNYIGLFRYAQNCTLYENIEFYPARSSNFASLFTGTDNINFRGIHLGGTNIDYSQAFLSAKDNFPDDIYMGELGVEIGPSANMCNYYKCFNNTGYGSLSLFKNIHWLSTITHYGSALKTNSCFSFNATMPSVNVYVYNKSNSTGSFQNAFYGRRTANYQGDASKNRVNVFTYSSNESVDYTNNYTYALDQSSGLTLTNDYSFVSNEVGIRYNLNTEINVVEFSTKNQLLFNDWVNGVFTNIPAAYM
jgi:hypothetical protein